MFHFLAVQTKSLFFCDLEVFLIFLFSCYLIVNLEFQLPLCGYHGFLGPDPLFNRPGARASPLPAPSHEATPLY